MKKNHHQCNTIDPTKKARASLLIALLIFSTACSSKSKHELQSFDYKEAIRTFQEQQHDTPGVWSCSYSENSNPKTAADTKSLMVEIDETYVYIKKDNQLIELSLAARKDKITTYNNEQKNLHLKLKIIKQSNYSEYQESHDRIIDAELEVSGKNYKLQLLGEACGI